MFTYATSLLFSHFQVLLGYAICVLFPLPWLNRAILDIWQKIGGSVMAYATTALGRFTPTPGLPSPPTPAAADADTPPTAGH